MKLLRSSGFWTLMLAGLHVTSTVFFYEESVRSVLDAGVLGALDEDPDRANLRGIGFWYATAGFFLGFIGLMVLRSERRGEGAPRGFAWATAATGVWGVLLTPASGFWLFLPVAWLAWRNTTALKQTIATG